MYCILLQINISEYINKNSLEVRNLENICIAAFLMQCSFASVGQYANTQEDKLFILRLMFKLI